MTEQEAKQVQARIQRWCPEQEVRLDKDETGEVYVQLRTFATDIRCEIWSNALLGESVATMLKTHQQAIADARQKYKPFWAR